MVGLLGQAQLMMHPYQLCVCSVLMGQRLLTMLMCFVADVIVLLLMLLLFCVVELVVDILPINTD